MFLFKKFLYQFIHFFNVHPEFFDLVRSGFSLTNPKKAEFPSENLPLASRVIASGMWNYCFFQFYRNFIGPYWVERQYNPKDPSFIPRASSMLSLNLTHRNWFGFRGPNSSSFSIIDPAGAFSPVIGYYTIELAFRHKYQFFTPNRNDVNIKIELEENLPIPIITYTKNDLQLKWKLIGDKTTNTTILSLIEYRVLDSNWDLIIGIRPFNTEGGTIINHLLYEEEENFASVYVNHEKEIIFLTKPDEVHLSNLETGDAYLERTNNKEINCPHGVSTGALIYRLSPSLSHPILFYVRTYEQLAPAQLDPFDSIGDITEKRKTKAKDVESNKKIKTNYILRCYEPITNIYKNQQRFYQEIEDSKSQWKESVSKKSSFITAKKIWNEAADVHSNIVFELQTEKKITPGVYTYRQFWFRDSAFMLSALSSWNFLEETRKVLETYPKRQESDGFFKSHEGEWDSTGQAIWTIIDYYKKSGDLELLKETLPSIIKGAHWIIKKRRKGYQKKLLPSGFSAEHLGPADYYYWDNLWSIAGLRDAAYACSLFPEFKEHHKYFQKQMEIYAKDFLEISRYEREKYGVLTAAPNRDIDPGIIGSIVDLYPLQLNLLSHQEIQNTLRTLYKNYFIDNLFFHPIIHSGFNIYLSLQVAHSFLKLNQVKIARKILKNVLKKRGKFWAYPEAIHPTTEGGVMGDGFHGWASSELILLFRELVISETKDKIFIFKGIRKKDLWNSQFLFGPFPLLRNKLTIKGHFSQFDSEILFDWNLPLGQEFQEKEFIINLPFKEEIKNFKIQMEPHISHKIIRNQIFFIGFPQKLKIHIYKLK
ncbi:MAG: hypothetical protein NZ853_04080 [Leptospiraceae bacterium]|nr:hypothetical protein [Leptospiraceae bacterium]MDW7975353.1 hypothetical protein [Leptospiraceae bacterium]